MSLSSSDLFDRAGQASRSGQYEEAIRLLDQCICLGPAPGLVIQAYSCLAAEIWFGRQLAMRKPTTPEDRLWCIRGAECNSRVIQVHRFYTEAGHPFDDFIAELIDKAESNTMMTGMYYSLHKLNFAPPEKEKALATPLKCLAVPWNKLTIATNTSR